MTRILFIDDDETTLLMLRKVAAIEGHEAHTASSAAAALQLVDNLKPEIIFLDLMMPEMDGIQILNRLQANPQTSGIPVIILSAGLDMDASKRARAAGARGYFPKPISINTLREVIDEYT